MGIRAETWYRERIMCLQEKSAFLGFALQCTDFLLVVCAGRRPGMADGTRSSWAALLAFIIPSKVLSLQHLIRLFPFPAVTDGPAGRHVKRVFVLCCVVTALVYPGPCFIMVLDHQAEAMLLLNLRNMLLVCLLGMLLFGPAAEERRGLG
jgi:hypothetical protein